MGIVINTCRGGGFGLSHKAVMRYAKLKGIKLYRTNDFYTTVPTEDYEKAYKEDELRIVPNGKGRWQSNDLCFHDYRIERNDPALIQVIKELGDKANGRFAQLKIVEIPDDVEWEIEDYDGVETIAEKHREWD